MVLSSESLQRLDKIVRLSVQGDPDESVAYGVLNEMLFEHKNLFEPGTFIVFPQLWLKWNPKQAGDRRGDKPDVGIGRLRSGGSISLQGGAEQKAALLPLMRSLPPASKLEIESDMDTKESLRSRFERASSQARDQVKAAIRNGAIPYDVVVPWLVVVGPYFVVKEIGPFTEAERNTREYKPNDSGDFLFSEVANNLRDNAAHIPILERIYRIGTPEAAVAIDAFLRQGLAFYDNDNRL
ncbi:hypothetical protein VNI00_006630 [Paramarasmius palmivorus]|uniref:Uncharacterized protein n=1 Tax=Paramarasmius palmivorus TaxID=297713 RepID=A0AAW0D9G8_9AGAR